PRTRGVGRGGRSALGPMLPSPPMDWKPEMDELRRREAFAEALGGPERVKRQHDGGRLTIRERIERLLDAGSFHEVGKIAGRPQDDGRNELVNLTPSALLF